MQLISWWSNGPCCKHLTNIYIASLCDFIYGIRSCEHLLWIMHARIFQCVHSQKYPWIWEKKELFRWVYFFKCRKFALGYTCHLIGNKIEHSVLISLTWWEESIVNFLDLLAKLTHMLFSLLERLQISLGYWAVTYNSLSQSASLSDTAITSNPMTFM